MSSPVAVSGNRFAGWVVRAYPEDWAVLCQRRGDRGYDLLFASSKEPDPKATWRGVKESFADRGIGWL